MNVSGVHTELLKDLSFEIRSAEDQRAYVTQDGLRAIVANDRMVCRLHAARDRAKADALKNLARYKFSNFGYHAARWVTLNALIGDKQPNPFKALVMLARQMVREVRA